MLMERIHFLWSQVRNSLGLAEENEDEGGGGGANSSLASLWGKKLKNKDKGYSRAELSSLWSLLQQEEYTFLRYSRNQATVKTFRHIGLSLSLWWHERNIHRALCLMVSETGHKLQRAHTLVLPHTDIIPKDVKLKNGSAA